MIAIINKGKPENPKQEDERMYEVRINKKPLFYFLHNRGEGLAKCLARAANAVDQYGQLTNIMKNRRTDDPIV